MSERKPYVIAEPEATLVLDETTAFNGAEIDVSLAVDWDSYIAIRRWVHEFKELDDTLDLDEVDRAFRAAAALFVPFLKGWNLADSRGPIPPTVDGLLSLRNSALMVVIITAWLGAVGTAPPPLSEGSRDGEQPSPTPNRATRRRRPKNSS